MKFKKHIADLFDLNNPADQIDKIHWEIMLSGLFTRDPEAEVRVHIKGQIYFIQITDMESQK